MFLLRGAKSWNGILAECKLASSLNQTNCFMIPEAILSNVYRQSWLLIMCSPCRFSFVMNVYIDYRIDFLLIYQKLNCIRLS